MHNAIITELHTLYIYHNVMSTDRELFSSESHYLWSLYSLYKEIPHTLTTLSRVYNQSHIVDNENLHIIMVIKAYLAKFPADGVKLMKRVR